MTEEPNVQQGRTLTADEQFKMLFARTSKLNDSVSALLSPGWGAKTGIIPEGHPLHPTQQTTALEIVREDADPSAASRLRDAEIGRAVAEHEANAYRNQVQALIREMQRMSEEGFQRPVDIIVMDGRPVVEDPESAETIDTPLAALVQDTLGIFLGAGQPVPAFALDNACRQLAKSEAAREYLNKDRDEARNWARHGYEIGQRHCGWSDHGVAPAWLTEGWPRSFDSCEHTKQAAEYDTALTRVRGFVRDLEVNANQMSGTEADNVRLIASELRNLIDGTAVTTGGGTCTAALAVVYQDAPIRCTQPAGHYDFEVKPDPYAEPHGAGGWHVNGDYHWADFAEGATPHGESP